MTIRNCYGVFKDQAEFTTYLRLHYPAVAIAVSSSLKESNPMSQTSAQTIQDTLNSRAKTHGSFIDNGFIMQTLKNVMRNHGKNWQNLPLEQREALEMIQHKIGRILSGNPTEPDHWRDIAGYASLIENILVTGQSHVEAK